MNRFFVDPGQISGGFASITGEDVKHIVKVLRLGPGDEAVLCDGAGTDYLARIDSLDRDQVHFAILRNEPANTEPRTRVTLYQGLPKAGKMELIIQKCVELGVCAVVPVAAHRSVVKLSAKEFEAKRNRYQRISYEASKQARRSVIPQIGSLASFSSADMARHDLVLIADEEEKEVSLKGILRSRSGARDIAVVIGPEGGLERSEVMALKENGGVCLSLGPRILRTETAGMAALAMILYELEDMV